MRRWRRSTLGEIACWGSGGTPQAGNPTFYGGDIPWAVIGDLNDGLVTHTAASITEHGLQQSSAKLVPVGAVMVAMYGSIGKLGIAGAQMATNQAIASAIPHDWVDPDFLFYYLLSQRQSLDAAGKGATQRNIGQAVLKAWPIRYPELSEQRRIVALLEEHLSALDDASRSLKSVRERSEALWISALRRAQETAQKHGALSSIGQLADTSLGKMLDAKRQVGELTPYLRNINVRWGRFDLDDLQTTPLTDADRNRLVLEEGDLLVCEGGEPGRCAVWRQPESGIAFQKALHRVRIAEGQRMTPEFLAAMIEEGIRAGRWERFFTGTTIKHLPQQQLRRLEVPVPPMQLQEGLVAQLAEQREALDRLREQVAMTERREQSLRQAVLAAAFSGRVTGHGSDTDVIEEFAKEESA